MSIQRVELNTFYDAPIHCPFCGQRVSDPNAEEESELLRPCKHTLFFVHDEGVEYRSSRFNENLNLSDDEDFDSFEEDFESLTDRVTIVDSVKFACYAGAPSGFGSYVGFAPLAND